MECRSSWQDGANPSSLDVPKSGTGVRASSFLLGIRYWYLVRCVHSSFCFSFAYLLIRCFFARRTPCTSPCISPLLSLSLLFSLGQDLMAREFWLRPAGWHSPAPV